MVIKAIEFGNRRLHKIVVFSHFDGEDDENFERTIKNGGERRDQNPIHELLIPIVVQNRFLNYYSHPITYI
jgi:hypothetical protein